MIGSMRHRITLQKPVIANNEYGVPVITWTDVATVWAQKAMKRVSYPTNVAERTEVVTYFVVTIRYRTDVAHDWRIVESGQASPVVSVYDADGARKFLCLEVETRA